MKTDLPKVIYVTGLAYSGTTLFSAALGHSENFFNGGEVNYLENDYHHNKLCSCGQIINDCKVWGSVLKRLENDAKSNIKTLTFTQEQTLRAIDKRSKPLRIRILTLFGARPEQLFEEDELKDYALRHRNFLCSLSSSVNANFVVDASKNSARLQVLRRYSDLPIHVIYVRRSIIQSYASRLKRAKRRNKFYLPLFAPVYLGVIFFRVRGLRRRLRTYDQDMLSIVDYESFVENPQSVETQLSKELNTPVSFGIKYGEFGLGHLHVFTGNVWLSHAAKVGKKVKIETNDGRATLSWFENYSFRLFSPVFKLFNEPLQ